MVTFQTPSIIPEHNKRTQGVDRLDLLRARFLLCDGHSFKKWHKKLSMGIIDHARVNAYQSQMMVEPSLKVGRFPYQDLIGQLAAELMRPLKPNTSITPWDYG